MSEHPADEPGRPEAAGGEAARGADPGVREAGAEPPRHAEAELAMAAHDAAGAEEDELAIARRRLAEVSDLPVEEHAAVYEEVHRSLQDALGEAGREREPDDGAGEGSGADRRAPDDGARDR